MTGHDTWPSVALVSSMRQIASALSLVPAIVVSAPLFAASQTLPSKTVQMEILGTDESVYLISGGGGNTLAVVDDDTEKVILIDTKLPGWGQTVADAINLVTNFPVVTIINTHAHEDHTGSNDEFAMVERIVAHENTHQAMVQDGRRNTELPNLTFAEQMTLLEGENQIDLYYFGTGHTNGDLIVVFPAKGLAYLGDLFATKAVPVIDIEHGGSGIALPETLATVLRTISGVTKVVTGEMLARNQYAGRTTPIPGAATLEWEDLEEYTDFCREFVDAVRLAHDTGVSVGEAVRGLTLLDRYPNYGMEHAQASAQAIYDELKR